jgi:hypothetical protein
MFKKLLEMYQRFVNPRQSPFKTGSLRFLSPFLRQVRGKKFNKYLILLINSLNNTLSLTIQNLIPISFEIAQNQDCLVKSSAKSSCSGVTLQGIGN